MHTLVKRLAILIGLSACAFARADGQVYLCIDANGHKELTDIGRKGNCKLLDLPPPNQTAAPPKILAPAARPNTMPAMPTPSKFPKVNNAEQKARDADRRQILQDELNSEQHKLAELKKELNDGTLERNSAKSLERGAQMKDNVSRAEKNVEALKREIGNIR